MKLPPPSRADWGDGCMDADYAYEAFKDKTVQEAEAMFSAGGVFDYQEDFVYMPPRILDYYLPAYLNYLLSPGARGDCDGASGFITFVMGKAHSIERHWPAISVVLAKIAGGQQFFGADMEIYGNFAKRVRELRSIGLKVDWKSADEREAKTNSLDDGVYHL